MVRTCQAEVELERQWDDLVKRQSAPEARSDNSSHTSIQESLPVGCQDYRLDGHPCFGFCAGRIASWQVCIRLESPAIINNQDPASRKLRAAGARLQPPPRTCYILLSRRAQEQTPSAHTVGHLQPEKSPLRNAAAYVSGHCQLHLAVTPTASLPCPDCNTRMD